MSVSELTRVEILQLKGHRACLVKITTHFIENLVFVVYNTIRCVRQHFHGYHQNN